MRNYFVTFILILLTTTQSFGSIINAPIERSCAATHFLYSGLSEHTIITGLAGGLKDLNDHAFKGQNSRSEVIFFVIHALFQQSLQTQFLNTYYRVTSRKAPNIKYNQVSVTCHSNCSNILFDSILIARRITIEKATKFFETGDRTILDNYGSYLLPDGSSILSLPNSSEIKKIGLAIKSYFGSWQGFQRQLEMSYTIGLGPNELDSLFGSELSASSSSLKSQTANAPIAEFNISEFISQLAQVRTQKNSLNWLFGGQDDRTLSEIFSLLRKNTVEKDIKNTSKAYQTMIANYRQPKTEDGSRSLQNDHIYLSQYIRRLKLFGYLPAHLIPKDNESRKRFNDLKHPTLVGHVDVKGLGAHGLLSTHKQLDNLFRASRNLEDAANKALANSTGGIPGIRSEDRGDFNDSFEALQHIRKNIFFDTNSFLLSIKAELRKTLTELGADESSLVIWSAGDDMFFTTNIKNIDAEKVTIALKTNPKIGPDLRVVTQNVKPGTKNVDLHKVRQDLGGATEPLKAIESLGLPDDYAAIYQGNSKSRLRILKFVQSDKDQVRVLAPLDPGSLSLFESLTPNAWKLEP